MATAPTVGSAAPRASPHTARICCSNWLVRAASSVQWPLLCGRGASSLTSSRPSLTNSSTASTPTKPRCVGDAQRQAGRLGRHVGVDPSRDHGEVEDAADVMVLGDRVHGRAAIGRAGDEHAELGVERHPLLHDARHAELVEGGGELGRRADRRAVPCRRSRGGRS